MWFYVLAFVNIVVDFMLVYVVCNKTNSYKELVIQFFLVSCQTELLEEVQNGIAVPNVDDSFRPDEI